MRGTIASKMGEIQITPDVTAAYAGMTAVECFGIVGMAKVSVQQGLVKLLKREKDGLFNTSFLNLRRDISPPVAEVWPQPFADEGGFAHDKLAISAACLLDGTALPFP